MSLPGEAQAVRPQVIALVASAGGLDALSAVLRALPDDLPAAVVVAQHLGGQGSYLVEILGRRTTLPVAWAQPGVSLVPGTVTVCPPRSRLEVMPDLTCSLTPRAAAARDDRILDALLLSLADSVGEKAVAVVLTGMGSDGALGCAALHDAGGLVVAQSEETSEHPGMPRAAVDAGAVDLVLPLSEIGSALADAVAGRRLPLWFTELEAISDLFGSTGPAAAVAAEIDWARTPVGRVTDWSPVLRTVVRLVMASPDPAILWWGKDLLFFTNDAAQQLLGDRGRATFVRPFRELFADLWPQVEPALERAFAGRPGHYRSVLMRHRDEGRVRDLWVDVTDLPIVEADQQVAGVYRVLHDRTALVLSARRLTTINALGRAARGGTRRAALLGALQVLRPAPDVPFALAYLLDLSGVRAGLVGATAVEEGGPMAPRELRMAPGTAWPLHDVVSSGVPAVVDDLATRFRGHVLPRRDDGGERVMPTRAWVHPLHDDADDRVIGVLVLGVDPCVTFDDGYREFLGLAADTVAVRASEAQARQRERERLERLAELDRAKTEFFSNVSHEFRTPLTLMLGPLDAAMERAAMLPADLVPELELARRNARRLMRLTAALLDFSQLEAGRMRPRRVRTDLASLTRRITAQFAVAAERAGLELRTAIEPCAPVWVDPLMWEKILANLISNAVKYTFAGRIEVSLRPLPQHAELVVRDTGVGIPEDELPYIFQRFHRVHGARGRSQDGAGIGLALVDELVRRHRGRVRATSEPGQGSVFTVWLPFGPQGASSETDEAGGATSTASDVLAVATAMAEEAERWDGAEAEPTPWDDEEAAQAVSRAASLPARVPDARILVVDDNRDMRDYLDRLLGAHWTVQLARDGAQALELAHRDPPDLVLSDITMPGLDGFALLAALRADPARAGVPVVLVTARAGEEAGIEGLLAGADDYIVKPFSARELVARVGARLELARLRRRQT